MATGSAVQSVVPPLYVVVGPDGLLEDTSIFWCEDGALNPLLMDVVSKIAEGLGLCRDAEGHEHRSDLVVRQEREAMSCGALRLRYCMQFGDQALAPMVDK